MCSIADALLLSVSVVKVNKLAVCQYGSLTQILFFVNNIANIKTTMYLEKIEIQGFKSFAQLTTIVFPRPGTDQTCGVACIVGPNGSGKSNIVDAIRWVLGEQSLKNLRGKKSEDVIFSGSEQKSRLSVAKVAMHIDNRTGGMPVDFETVVISRKIYRNGESDYFVNNKKVRLQDVLLLVAKSNFGQKSYSIVSQGTIDQVITASPAARKEYFDEAVGVKQFQIKRDQSINKLEAAWNNLRQVDALLSEIEPRLNSLTRQVKRLERREKVEAELGSVQQNYYGSRWQELQRQLAEVKPKLEKETAVLKDKEKATRDIQAELNALEHQDTQTEAFNQLQKTYQSFAEQRSKLREEQLMLQNKLELAKQRQTEIPLPLPVPKILERLRQVITLENSLEKNLQSREAAKLAQALEDSRELGRLLNDLIAQLENPHTKQQAKAELDPALLKDLEETTNDLKGVEAKLAVAQQQLQKFNQTEQQQKGKFFELQRRFQTQQQEYNVAAQRASELRVELARVETHLQELEREVTQELFSTDWLAGFRLSGPVNLPELLSQIGKLKHQLELIGGIDPESIKEYEETKQRFDFLSTQAEDLRTSIKSLEQVITDLDDKIQQQFDDAFKHINKAFGKFFTILFDGGKAELKLLKEDVSEAKPEAPVLTDGLVADDAEALDVAEPGSILDKLMQGEEQLSPKRFLKKRTGKVITGIDIMATPPGKKVHTITMLSGGERSLASIALICAVISSTPPPFVVLDEVDAALDEANSQRFSKIIGELAHKTQFIVITHNRATMHVANILYGVTMSKDGTSRLLSLQLEEAAKMVRQ